MYHFEVLVFKSDTSLQFDNALNATYRTLRFNLLLFINTYVPQFINFQTKLYTFIGVYFMLVAIEG